MASKRVGFISFRFAGTDGVSLETGKWATVLDQVGCECYFMAGELETLTDHSFIEEKLHFQHPEIKAICDECFGNTIRPRLLTSKIHDMRLFLKSKIYEFIKTFNINLIVVENALTIPLNIPLALALTEVISETGMAVIAHHHDFFWERKRFLRNCVWDYFNMAFPPHLSSIEHVVINTSGQNQLALRTGISSTLIPNVMNFELGPPSPDDFSNNVRADLGISDDELFVLQPTRVVQRKGIEHAVELVGRMKKKAVLVISHASGDEGYEYQMRVREYADLMKIRAIFVNDIIKETRGETEDKRRIYVLEDIYPHADLITYPSLIEGFGNAFLEAIWFRKPILVNNYSIYATDIRPKGFRVIEMDNFISSETIKFTEKVLNDSELAQEMADVNYDLGLRYYSYSLLRNQLKAVLTRHLGDLKLESDI
ncbi:Glycosyltransferase [Olavius algarvensis spirochete endosymbiont]|uniref:glycosyltransferase family 4 protein n=1 Tax=Olavius algarvensis spirochete endosymbiont TaxID=260710 RepID=UPI000F1FDAF6|nr:glycosyltransferase family 4 protein [Olavius algarvensis spirochete endosymbiont]VDA99538.1 Glycosyltransferase [Olavius algarvensis spirochete endosymbiont]